MTIKTPAQVKAQFEKTGETVTDWAIQHGYTPQDVYKVLNGQAKCKRGKGHKIAVQLGIKPNSEKNITA
ncbi:transcriptional regulator [Acinetobacter pittii]|uniref:DNA-binding protein n=1 Tax=Acinetobacter TaxID=469 RepID=UPI0003007C90|nr:MULTISPECIES: DNA-binding protein [Acinetobacter]AUT33929.1 DNA-binding protein [Acinetobacter pittii]KRI14821.1 transcriptional regulator [Acinetobacter pittii]MCE6395202.1 DNA-binding protein [Acinetobacter pittii]MCU4609503.1 DNA-binding protein [Acinetobacter ursingii]MDQ8918190.1 DNA-binding protein [Acinetobacter baumannii]